MVSREEFVKMLKSESPSSGRSMDEWTPDRVAEDCQRYQMLAKSLLTATQSIPIPSSQVTAARNIVENTNLQLQRLAGWVKLEADLSALINRNLIELKFWSSFIAESEDNATRFLTESIVDMF